MLNQIAFCYLSVFGYTLGITWDCYMHSLSLMMRPRTFLLHRFGKIAYSHISAYSGICSNIVLITSVHFS